jgi:hypothetical protein
MRAGGENGYSREYDDERHQHSFFHVILKIKKWINGIRQARCVN